jgi:hypothetical protein
MGRVTQDKKQTVATLAAAIVVSRGAKSVAEIQGAWNDAVWIVYPMPTDARYKAWQESQGGIPTTLAEDTAIKLAKRQAAARAVPHVAR